MGKSAKSKNENLGFIAHWIRGGNREALRYLAASLVMGTAQLLFASLKLSFYGARWAYRSLTISTLPKELDEIEKQAKNWDYSEKETMRIRKVYDYKDPNGCEENYFSFLQAFADISPDEDDESKDSTFIPDPEEERDDSDIEEMCDDSDDDDNNNQNPRPKPR